MTSSRRPTTIRRFGQREQGLLLVVLVDVVHSLGHERTQNIAACCTPMIGQLATRGYHTRSMGRTASDPDGSSSGRVAPATAGLLMSRTTRVNALAFEAPTRSSFRTVSADAHYRARFLIRDRDGKFPHLFDVILSDAGIEVVLSGVQMPRMNSIVERWIQTCRHELLDRHLIWNQRHLLHAHFRQAHCSRYRW
jgi:hypothetical protein